MVKAKITQAPAPTSPAATVGKKHPTKRGVLKYKTHVKRLCKTLDIPQPNKDALTILNGAIEAFLSSIIAHLSVMYADTNKRLTKKSVQLAFIAQMDKQGASQEVCKAALERASKAMEALGASLEAVEVKEEKKKK
jgi:histone H3/H4